MGLGYDSASDDYKVVSIGLKSTWIFELRSNSWRRIESIDDEFFPEIKYSWLDSACFAHGNLHWLYNPTKTLPNPNFDDELKIFAFDMAKEIFSQVMMPPVNPAGGRISDLYIVKERLCVSYFHSAASEVHLYFSNKDGDNYTWRKVCSMQLHLLGIKNFNCVKIVGYSEEENKILLDAGSVKSGMISYDLKGKVLSKVDFPVKEYTHGWKPRMFVPSFVPVGVESTSAWKPLREELSDEKKY